MKIASKEAAQIARDKHEVWNLFKDSALGHDFLTELARIDEQSIKKAMLGKTPIDSNEYLEARGQMLVTSRIRRLFVDVEDAGKEAINWQATADASQNQG